jgi:hypothetical protein
MILTIDRDDHPQSFKNGADSRLTGRDEGCRLAAVLAADCFDVPLQAILAGTRGTPKSAYARQAAMYLSHVALGTTLSAIGRFFSRDHSTVAHACRRVEDRRDDPAFDALIGELGLAARLALHLDTEIAA